MHQSHPLQFLAFASLATAIIVSAPQWAFSGPTLHTAEMRVVKSPEHIVQLAARKGTRNYKPDVTTSPNETGNQGGAALSYPTYTLEKCMETWDRDTHITKDRWREICKRQIKELESSTGN